MNPATTKKLHALEDHLRRLGSAVVAYSGGVDSAFLAVIAHRALGPRMTAVLGMLPSVAQREIEDAEAVAGSFGFPLARVATEEMENPLYVANSPDRCFHCKDELFDQLESWASERGFRWVLDGTNADDLGDFRPGIKAARNHGVRSPLADLGWSKEEIRAASLELGVPIWDKPGSPCLASRIPHGEPVRLESLKRVEVAEAALRRLGFGDLRVRAHGETARVEFLTEDLDRLADPQLRDAVERRVRAAGFEEVVVDPKGYRPSGSRYAAGEGREGPSSRRTREVE